MGIRSASGYVRTTIALPVHVLEGIDKAVKAGDARSRNELLTEAAERELKRLRREAIDRAFLGMADDAELQAENEQIMKEFEAADSETARLLDAMDGGWKG
jgi:metal-responsive CopG/Arc/MetJ family transcriptional regulator